jgi:hypothetical protein
MSDHEAAPTSTDGDNADANGREGGDVNANDTGGDAASDTTTMDSPVADSRPEDSAPDASTTPITFIQDTAATPPGSVASASTSFARAQRAGNFIVVVIGWVGSATVMRIYDSSGNGYTPAVGPSHISAGPTQWIYYAKAIAAAAAGANIVTVAFSASASAVDLRALEYAGLDPRVPFDVAAGSGGRSISATSGPVTTTTPHELVFGAGITVGSFTGPGALFTLRKLTGGGLGLVEDNVVSSTGTYSADAPLASSASYVMQVATFR